VTSNLKRRTGLGRSGSPIRPEGGGKVRSSSLGDAPLGKSQNKKKVKILHSRREKNCKENRWFEQPPKDGKRDRVVCKFSRTLKKNAVLKAVS